MTFDEFEQELKSKQIILRNTKIMIETAAAKLYGISIERLRGILITNPERFPDDFLFILEDEERDEIKKSNPKNKSLIAFTDAGIMMLSGLVGNKKSLKVLVYIIKWAARNPDLLEGDKDIKEIKDVLKKMNELKFQDELFKIFKNEDQN